MTQEEKELEFLDSIFNVPGEYYTFFPSPFLELCEYNANTCIVLSEIVYWYRDGGKKLRVFSNGKKVLVKSMSEMCGETGLQNRYIVMRAYEHLKKLGLITTSVHRFKKAPTTYIVLDVGKFISMYLSIVNKYRASIGKEEIKVASALGGKLKVIKEKK